MIELSVFSRVPEFARGMPRDLRIRWALEEVGAKYQEVVVDRNDLANGAFRSLQPFDQMPFYKEDDLVLFESGAILLHIAEKHQALLPSITIERIHCIKWMFAALNTIEPPIRNLAEIEFVLDDNAEIERRRPEALARVMKRYEQLSAAMGQNEFILGPEFSAADILLVTVMRILGHLQLDRHFHNLAAYRRRCESRPAFQRALTSQIATLDFS